MSMDRDPNLYDRDPNMGARDTNLHTPGVHNAPLHNTSTNPLHDGETRVYDRHTGRGSNTLAYLIGGLVLALGLLAFLFYDGDRTGDVSTTGSTSTQTERSTTAPAPAAPGAPARPAAPQ